jgi:hypothetical protein
MTEPDLATENTQLRAKIAELTDRVIAESTNRVDAADLQRENNELRKLLAEGATSDAAIAKLREWTAGSHHTYEPGAIQIAMPVTMACKIIDEIDQLTLNQARAAHDLDIWLELHETEKGSARIASAREKLEGAGA